MYLSDNTKFFPFFRHYIADLSYIANSEKRDTFNHSNISSKDSENVQEINADTSFISDLIQDYLENY